MERAEILALVSLVISVLLLLRLFAMQSRINELKSDLARLEGRAEVYPSNKQAPSAPVYSSPISTNPSELAPELEQRLRYLVADGKRIQAIKELREARNLSLKDAKDYVDAMERR